MILMINRFCTQTMRVFYCLAMSWYAAAILSIISTWLKVL